MGTRYVRSFCSRNAFSVTGMNVLYIYVFMYFMIHFGDKLPTAEGGWVDDAEKKNPTWLVHVLQADLERITVRVCDAGPPP